VFRGDEPIEKASDDALGRSDLAEGIAKLIRGFSAAEGVVIGILGPWGSGKTSLINLMEEALSGDEDSSLAIQSLDVFKYRPIGRSILQRNGQPTGTKPASQHKGDC
jgi:pantothenate kinase-related protein Tda10